MLDEHIVYLLRKTSLNREEIGQLSPLQFIEILNEVYYQENLEHWDILHNLASILAAIYNTIPRQRGSKAFEAKDFLLTNRPSRGEDRKDRINEMAENAGIIIPKEQK